MLDSSGDGWEGASAELYVDGQYVDFMTLEAGDYEVRVIGLGVNCEQGEASNVEGLDAAPGALELFPNPGQDRLTIRSSMTRGSIAPIVQVFQANGRLVMDASNQPLQSDGTWLLDASSWAPGMYIVRVTQDGQTHRLPWMKVH